MKKTQGSGLVIGLVLVFLVLGAGGVFLFFTKQPASPNPALSPVPTISRAKGDIDRSGVADEMDKTLVRSQLGCRKEDPCWQKTVSKTKDGDNPLYTFDLDLNGDGVIDDKDLALVTP